MNEIIRFIASTRLSRKPANENVVVGFMSVGVLALVSLVRWSDFMGLASLLPATGESVFVQHEYWRLFTSLAVHADVKHLLSNSLGFGLFAYLLFDYFGFFVFPFVSIVLGIAVQILSLRSYPPEVSLVGASGMLYAMVGVWLALYCLVERRLTLGKRLMRCFGFALAVLMPSTFEAAVSYRAHGIGFAVGIAFGFLYFLLKKSEFRGEEVWGTEVIEPLQPVNEQQI